MNVVRCCPSSKSALVSRRICREANTRATPLSLSNLRWDIFCRVIDNYGDAGVCWRLAIDLAQRGESVRLFIDQPEMIDRLRGKLVHPLQQPPVVLPWPNQQNYRSELEVADVVIEAFACDPPETYIQAMADCAIAGKPPVWINLEYLSAEDWIEQSHALPSPHPRLPLTKYFYFPGFTVGTGGLIREPAIQQSILAKDHSPGGSQKSEIAVFLFGYEQPLLADWLTAINQSAPLVRLGVAPCALQAQIDQWIERCIDIPTWTLDLLPFVPQSEFDALLASFDLLFVRGEDSFVRAQWAAKPVFWQIYPQDDHAHLVKLRAFYARYLNSGVLNAHQREVFEAFILAWNGVPPNNALGQLWSEVIEMLPALEENARIWRNDLMKQRDLVTQLRDFVAHLVK